MGSRRWHRPGSRVAVVACVMAALAGPGVAGAVVVGPAAAAGVRILGGGFNVPAGVSSDGTHVWVANDAGNSVSELNAATGRLVRVITDGPGFFNGP
jgi:hypothetical protein